MANIHRHMIATVLLLLSIVATAPSRADEYPSKPVTIVVPFPPGGPADIATRTLARKLAESWNVQVIVSNKAGANGIVGSEIVARAQPDGYTLLTTGPGHASNVSLYKKLPYDTMADFQPLSLLLIQPSMLVVHPKSSVRSLQALLSLARSKPGVLTYASGGSGSSQHLAAELLRSLTPLDVVHIPYKGTSPAEADMVAGHVDFMFTSMTSGMNHVRAGQLIPLAISTANRSSILPDIPTVSEAGVPGYDASTWIGLYGPRGLPAQVIQRIEKDVARIMQLPDVKASMAASGAESIGSSPKEFDRFLRNEIDKWATVVKNAKMTVQ